MVRVGFIKKTMPYGCFVEFPNNCCGLAPIKSLSDEFVVNPADLYQEMQTVRAKASPGKEGGTAVISLVYILVFPCACMIIIRACI